jgi:hypothetical protein
MVSDFYFLTTDLARRNTGTFIRLQRKPKNIFLFPCLSACRAIALATAGVIPWLTFFSLNPKSAIQQFK